MPSGIYEQGKIISTTLDTISIEVLNWNGTIYSTKLSTYNVRDQLTAARVFQGTGPSPAIDDGTTCANPLSQGYPAFGPCQKTAMSYDGYGRVDKVYRPIYKGTKANTPLNPTPFELYEYNADDTIKKKTDPRGVIKELTYNSRHLVTGISYTVPAGVQPTPGVTFDYDANGNRLWMVTAGLGRVDYTYDTLSRMTQETRTFNDAWAPSNFTISYGYNLANQITSVSVPGRSVTYGLDKTGRLSDVTGSGYGASSLMSSFQYRAWGAPKHYSLSTTSFDFTYNSRLQVLTKNVGQVRPSTYSYYEDGGLKQILRGSGSPENYAYEYDHVGRMTKAKSGGAVTGDSTVGPYQQTLGYDEFSHLTARNTKSWDFAPVDSTTTYIDEIVEIVSRVVEIIFPCSYIPDGKAQLRSRLQRQVRGHFHLT